MTKLGINHFWNWKTLNSFETSIYFFFTCLLFCYIQFNTIFHWINTCRYMIDRTQMTHILEDLTHTIEDQPPPPKKKRGYFSSRYGIQLIQYTVYIPHFFHVDVFLWNLPSLLHGITCIASRQVGTFDSNPCTEAPEAEDASRVPPSSTIKMLTRFLKQDSTKTDGQTTKPGLLPGFEACKAYPDFLQVSFIKEKSDLG